MCLVRRGKFSNWAKLPIWSEFILVSVAWKDWVDVSIWTTVYLPFPWPNNSLLITSCGWCWIREGIGEQLLRYWRWSKELGVLLHPLHGMLVHCRLTTTHPPSLPSGFHEILVRVFWYSLVEKGPLSVKYLA